MHARPLGGLDVRRLEVEARHDLRHARRWAHRRWAGRRLPAALLSASREMASVVELVEATPPIARRAEHLGHNGDEL